MMDKKHILIIGTIVIVLFSLVSVFFYTKSLSSGPIKNDYYTVEPQPWIEDTPYDDNSNNVKINVGKASRGQSIYDVNKQEIYHDGLKTLFYSGIYKGNSFETMFLDIGFGNDTEDNYKKYSLMEIDPELDPTDGIIEGFILGKYEDDEFVFYIFVDEDWKNNLEYTNIIYGNNIDSFKFKQFDFSIEEKGVYVDKIKGDFDWFTSSPRMGGVYVGEISLETIDTLDVVNKSFMYVR
jgi:hypothetical protein